MKTKNLLRTGFFSLIVIGSLFSFLYLNTGARGEIPTQALEFYEGQIIENMEKLENKKSLPEAFLLKQLVEMGKKLIP